MLIEIPAVKQSVMTTKLLLQASNRQQQKVARKMRISHQLATTCEISEIRVKSEIKVISAETHAIR